MNLSFNAEMCGLAMKYNNPGEPFYEKMRCIKEASELHLSDLPDAEKGPKIMKLLNEADEWDKQWQLEKEMK